MTELTKQLCEASQLLSAQFERKQRAPFEWPAGWSR